MPNPLGKIGSLILNRRIPPRIEMNNIIGGGEVQSGPACLELIEEEIPYPVLKRCSDGDERSASRALGGMTR